MLYNRKPKPFRTYFAKAYRRGVTLNKIADELGISRRTLLFWRKEMGLPARRPQTTREFKQKLVAHGIN